VPTQKQILDAGETSIRRENLQHRGEDLPLLHFSISFLRTER